MESTEKVLVGIIDANGPDYISDKPYETYKQLQKAKVPAVEARLVLITLTAGAAKKALTQPAESLSRSFQRSCALTRRAADDMAALYKAVFSEHNRRRWDEATGAGFREFCDRTWPFQWEGSASWSDNGSDDCWADLQAELKVTDPEKAYALAEPALQENPHASAEAVFKAVRDDLALQMEQSLDEYVHGDDYYGPVMEDFVPEYAAYELTDYCTAHGLAANNITGSGSAEWD